jgi:hypothetical protein
MMIKSLQNERIDLTLDSLQLPACLSWFNNTPKSACQYLGLTILANKLVLLLLSA